MSWSNGKAADPEPQTEEPKKPETAISEVEVIRALRHTVISEIQKHVQVHVPHQFAWIVNMALLDYGCRALVNEPEEADDQVGQK